LSIEPAPAAASPSVVSVQPGSTGTAPKGPGEPGDHNLTQATAAPVDPTKQMESIPVAPIASELASGRLSITSTNAPEGTPLHPAVPAAPTHGSAEQPSASPQVINIDDFVKVDLRVAQILVAERVPKADKLLRLEVDLGYEKRQILAGIAQYYEPEKLVGRKIVIVANLAPRKMRGLESNGMLLAASLPDGAPVLAGFLEEVPLGARLK
jgi:methionyl-tRNA synthetase